MNTKELSLFDVDDFINEFCDMCLINNGTNKAMTEARLTNKFMNLVKSIKDKDSQTNIARSTHKVAKAIKAEKPEQELRKMYDALNQLIVNEAAQQLNNSLGFIQRFLTLYHCGIIDVDHRDDIVIKQGDLLTNYMFDTVEDPIEESMFNYNIHIKYFRKRDSKDVALELNLIMPLYMDIDVLETLKKLTTEVIAKEGRDAALVEVFNYKTNNDDLDEADMDVVGMA